MCGIILNNVNVGIDTILENVPSGAVSAVSVFGCYFFDCCVTDAVLRTLFVV